MRRKDLPRESQAVLEYHEIHCSGPQYAAEFVGSPSFPTLEVLERVYEGLLEAGFLERVNENVPLTDQGTGQKLLRTKFVLKTMPTQG